MPLGQLLLFAFGDLKESLEFFCAASHGMVWKPIPR
jgi:hypothetical protein